MNKYQNGKIYKITSKQTDDVYIGSTIQTLPCRLQGHKTKYKCDKSASSKALMKYDDVIIELVELYPCETREDLLWRERYWIENTKCINVDSPIRTKEERKVYIIKYCEDNKTRRNESNKKRYLNKIDDIKKYRAENKESIKAWVQLNKVRVNSNRRFQYTEFGKLCKMY